MNSTEKRHICRPQKFTHTLFLLLLLLLNFTFDFVFIIIIIIINFIFQIPPFPYSLFLSPLIPYNHTLPNYPSLSSPSPQLVCPFPPHLLLFLALPPLPLLLLLLSSHAFLPSPSSFLSSFLPLLFFISFLSLFFSSILVTFFFFSSFLYTQRNQRQKSQR